METILNVDDYAPGRYARTKVLQQAGFTVWEAATGEEALRITMERNPLLILLDVNLPDMNGIEVCRQIRENPKTFSSTVVHISASNIQNHDQVAGLDGGADAYLVEPIDPVVLIATVRSFLRARKAENALRQSNEELEWFGHRVAHDLREPLRTITAHVELLERTAGPTLDKTAGESLRFVVDAASRMQSFIDGLLKFSQATHVGEQLQRIHCDRMISEIETAMEATIRASGVRLTHDKLPQVVADPGLEEVFQNLIGNSIKYARPGVPPEIHISANDSGDLWTFSVRDNGIGIEPAYQKDIFQIFRRLHGRSVAGNGIGLALSKKIVEAHGGDIWVESEPGQGSTFHFTLRKLAVPRPASARSF